jgi:CRISPR-associated protein Csb2
MPSSLALSIRFLDPTFHGRRDGGEPEWPPSPLRALQSLIAAAAAAGRCNNSLPKTAASALRWLEQQTVTTLVAPPAMTGSAYRLSVPIPPLIAP